VTLLARVLLERVSVEHSDSQQRLLFESQLFGCILQTFNGRTERRIRLNKADEFYQKSVVQLATKKEREIFWKGQNLEDPKARVHQLIVSAINFFDEVVDQHLDEFGAPGNEIRLKSLDSLVTALCDHFYVIRIRVSDERMAYRLFETLNERGMGLTQTDLVKNVVLEQAKFLGNDKVDSTYKAWTHLVDEVDTQKNLIFQK
jgi:uncharacterized protein with ParB-like and HNH nuclease domain